MKKSRHIYIGLLILIVGILAIIISTDFLQIVRWGFPDYYARKQLTSVLNRAIETQNINICDELPKTRKTLTTDGEIDSTGAWGTTRNCREQFSSKVTIKPVITYPANGSEINDIPITIKGKTNPNFNVWAYINYPEEDRSCISINSYANGGASKSDENGNFEITLAEPCSKALEVFVSVANPDIKETEECRKLNNQSEPIKFTNTGKIPELCNQ